MSEDYIYSEDLTALACFADIVAMYQNDRQKALDPKIKPRIINRCSRGHNLADPEIIKKGKVILMNRLRKNQINKDHGDEVINLNEFNQGRLRNRILTARSFMPKEWEENNKS